MLRNIGAAVAGLVVAVGVMLAVQWVGHQIYPVGRVNPLDREAVSAMIASLPTAALLIVAVAWFLGAFVGGVVALRLSRGRSGPAWAVGIVILLAAIGNLLAYPHPGWMWAAAVAAPLLGAFAANHLGGRRGAASQAARAP